MSTTTIFHFARSSHRTTVVQLKCYGDSVMIWKLKWLFCVRRKAAAACLVPLNDMMKWRRKKIGIAREKAIEDDSGRTGVGETKSIKMKIEFSTFSFFVTTIFFYISVLILDPRCVWKRFSRSFSGDTKKNLFIFPPQKKNIIWYPFGLWLWIRRRWESRRKKCSKWHEQD